MFAAYGNGKDAKGISAVWYGYETTEASWTQSFGWPRSCLPSENGNNAHSLPSSTY